MTKGVSIHIGVGELSPHYLGTRYGNMRSAYKDASDMLGILPNTFEKELLPDATTKQVREVICNYAVGKNKLSSGDLLVVSYSGHGGFISANDSFESDSRDETWCLHDSQLLDDELLEEWTKFDEGVRILVISDSCHSGTIIDRRLIDLNYKQLTFLNDKKTNFRNLETKNFLSKNIENTEFETSVEDKIQKQINEKINTNDLELDALDFPVRTLPRELLKVIFTANSNDYIQRKKIARKNLEETLNKNLSDGFNGLVKASVLLISACLDDQLAELSDNKRNGLFTRYLIDEWDRGNFTGNYLQFHQAIWKKIKHKQSPNYYKLGIPNPEFELQKPFTI